MKKRRFFLKDNFWIILVLIFFMLFCFDFYLISTDKVLIIDSFIYNLISKIICEPLTLLFKIVTEFGDKYIILSINLLCLIILKNKKYSLVLFSNLIISTITVHLLKYIFIRSRPIGIALIEESGYSFPSGHSFVSLAFYGLIIYLIYKSNLTKRTKLLLSISLMIIIILIGLSRIYLGVHYFSDVLGGFSLSICYLILFIKFIIPKVLVNK